MSYNTGMVTRQPQPMTGLCISEVAVDMKTGKPKVLTVKIWADCGVIANYLSAEGQAYGGIAQSLGYAYTEDYEDVKRHGNIIGAGLPSIDDVPDKIDVTWIEDNPCKAGPFGSNGLSECFFGGEHNAFLSGIYDADPACASMSFPPMRRRSRRGSTSWSIMSRSESKHYFFGEDFYDAYDEAIANPIPEDWLQQLMVQLMQDAKKDAAKKQAAAEAVHNSEPDADQTGIVEL